MLVEFVEILVSQGASQGGSSGPLTWRALVYSAATGSV